MGRLFPLLALVCAIVSVTVSHAATSGSRLHDNATPPPPPAVTPTGYHFQLLVCWQKNGTDASTQPKCLKKSKAGKTVEAFVYTVIYNVPPKSKGTVSLLIKQGKTPVSQAGPSIFKINSTANVYPQDTTYAPPSAGTYRLSGKVTIGGHTKTATATLKVK